MRYLAPFHLANLPEPWREVGQPGQPPLQSGWTHLGGGTGPDGRARFRRFPDGTVQLAGTIVSGTTGLPAFTLPLGYRPISRVRTIAIDTMALHAQVNINQDGTVTPYLVGGGGSSVSLDLIRFPVV